MPYIDINSYLFLTRSFARCYSGRTYEIASMEYHPYTQIPSFFLHPCRTNETISSLSKKGGLTIDRVDDALLTFLNLNLKLFPDQNLSLDEIGAVLKALEMK
jgi:hypothetical protein